MIYEPSYIYPNVLNAQGERCFYTMTDNTFRILINSDYPITSCTYRIYCPDGVLYKTGTVTGLNFYTNNIDGTQNLLEIGEVSLLNSSNKVRINGTTEINPNVFSDSTWTYQLSFTDTQGTPMDTNLYAFYITPSPDFVGIDIESDPEVALTNTTPYLHRASPQDVASSMKLKKVVGGTIAWNQLITSISSAYSSRGTLTESDGIYSYTVVTVGSTQYDNAVNASVLIAPIVLNHKYLLMADIKPAHSKTVRFWLIRKTASDGNNITSAELSTVENQWNEISTICVSQAKAGYFQISLNTQSSTGYSVGDVDQFKNFVAYDLTQMFGSTIADYIYSLEQAHAGDGVAWFKALFGEDYYPYNSGELLSVKTSARKTYNADNVEIGSYPLDDDLELRGIPKLDGNNELYYDGDTYASDGTVTRRYGVIDLGSSTLGWQRGASGDHYVFDSLVINKATGFNFVCPKYANARTYRGDLLDKQMGTYNLTSGTYRISIRDDSYSDATSFASAMSGVYLVYELATPTTESADAYTQSQRVGATEEFVDGRTVEIPVGNESEYYETTYPSRTISFTGNFTYASQPISWIQWSVYDSSDNLVYTTGMVYRSVATNFSFDGFDTGETYTVEFSASDTRGNISRATQEVSVSYTLVNQSNVIRTVVQDDSSMLVDWSGLQPIIGKAYNSGGTEVATPTFFVNNIPSAGHNSIKMDTNSTEKRVTFQSSDNLDIAIEETDFITWSGALYGNTNDILTATSNDGVMSLSLVGFDDGLYPNNSLYPSSSLYPKVVTLGRFKYTLPNGTIIYSDQNIDATNSWFFVELSPNKITVHREEYYKA